MCLRGAKNKKLKMLIGCKRLPRGRQALPDGAAGWDMIFELSHCAKVFWFQEFNRNINV
jgi:hypothetical protein